MAAVTLDTSALSSFVNGKKTYIAIIVAILVQVAKYYGYFLDAEELANLITTIFAGAAGIFLRIGVKKDAAAAQPPVITSTFQRVE